jgi:hypothetical protein
LGFWLFLHPEYLDRHYRGAAVLPYPLKLRRTGVMNPGVIANGATPAWASAAGSQSSMTKSRPVLPTRNETESMRNIDYADPLTGEGPVRLT